MTIKSISNNACTINIDVPEDQTDGIEPIIAASANASPNMPIRLNFHLNVNTFEIKIKNTRQGTVHLKSVELVSPFDDISGNYDITLKNTGPNSSEFSYNRDGIERKKRVRHIYQGQGLELAPNANCKVTLYTLPDVIKRLFLILTFTDEGLGPINLELKNAAGQWITFKERKKYNLKDIEIPPYVEKFDYKFEFSNPWPNKAIEYYPFDLNYPYRSKLIPANAERTIKVKSWRENQYANYGVEWGYNAKRYKWLDDSESQDIYSGLPNGGEQTLKIKRNDYYFGKPHNEAEYQNAWNEAIMFSFRPYKSNEDLSIKNGVKNTANCYIVDAKGTYKFPAVYGNAIKNGQPNSLAYTPLAKPNYAKETEWLTKFVDGAGNRINSPYITEATSAELVWTTCDDNIKNVRLEGSGINKYIYFQVTRPVFANAVIAVKNRHNKILWTWHIWITSSISKLPSGFLSTPIGYMDSRGGRKELKQDLELVQLEAKGKTNLKIPIEIYSAPGNGTAPFFTYGRIAPLAETFGEYFFIPDEKHLSETTITTCYDANDNEVKFSYSETELTLEKSINSPRTLGKVHSYKNVWNRDPLSNNPYKTVYDPSPAGYRIPSRRELKDAWPNIPDLQTGQVSTLKNNYNDTGKLGIKILGLGQLTTYFNSDGDSEKKCDAFFLYYFPEKIIPGLGKVGGVPYPIYAPILPIKE